MFVGFLFLDKNANERQAEDLLSEYNSTAEQVWNDYTEASWAYNTNITDHNNKVMVRKSLVSYEGRLSWLAARVPISGIKQGVEMGK